MKTRNSLQESRTTRFLILLYAITFVLIVIANEKLAGQTESHLASPADDAIVATIEKINKGAPALIFNPQFEGDSGQRLRTIQALLRIFNDSKSHPDAKCCAAAYLGMMRASEAADSLATNMALQPPLDPHYAVYGPPFGYNPVIDALVAIGNPSIRAVMRNLAESDDAKVREFSLQVLVRIDGDKDIVRLRLQKALKAEKDSQSQARLQAALKSLPTFQ